MLFGTNVSRRRCLCVCGGYSEIDFLLRTIGCGDKFYNLQNWRVSRCGSNEASSHLFLECDVFASLWYHVWQWLGISSVSLGDIRHHLQQFTTMPDFPRLTHPFFRIIWFATVWAIWKERNNRVFQIWCLFLLL